MKLQKTLSKAAINILTSYFKEAMRIYRCLGYWVTCGGMRNMLSSKSHGQLEFVTTMHKVRAGILKEVAAVYGDELEGFDAIHHDWNGPLDVRKVEQRGGI